jgi:PIN domain nuclease of toxin-antitoxin system
VAEWILDASALLALLNNESGADAVRDTLPNAAISAVNLAEVISRLIAVGMPEDKTKEILSALGLEVAPFTEEEAFQCGLLYPKTKPMGLSLGDRACLALAKVRGVRALTADRSWQALDIGVQIKLIR